MQRTRLLLEEVFVTEGVPQFTFVKPPNYADILLDVRRPGKPIILEGQSGTGKTTCIRRILDQLGDVGATEYLTARDASHVSKIEAIARQRLTGRYVIDDFHRLSQRLQASLADIAKSAAELGEGSNLPKLIIIGINEVGSDLIQLVPDIAKRTGIHRIKPGERSDILHLVENGCKLLNITIADTQAIYEETRGDYWLTQQLCQSICASENITETSAEPRAIAFETTAIRRRVVDKLRSAYYPAVKEFCRGRRFRPSNDPYFKLLRSAGQQSGSIVDLNELANANPEVRGSVNNIKERRLGVLIESKPLVARHFYYNSETKNFAIEDPALFYFIKHLDWNQLRQDCGFRDSEEDFEFEFALSFAGENRDLARHIAQQLEMLDVPVFFDEMFEANFLGSAWTKRFREIFGEKSKFVVCLLDSQHEKKIWPTFEREHFTPRVESESVIPIFLDDTKFLGIPRDIVGIHFKFDKSDEKWKQNADTAIIFKLLDRLD
jgi:hypothetical protein